jgi:protein involved in polysaccharide export with SLBB domain
LPLFGYNFFADGARSFAPVERMPAPADYVIGPGDELLVRGWGSVDIDYRAVVDRNGQINIPRVGSVRVAGVKASEVEALLAGRVARVFKNFNLNVTLGQLRSIQVFVVGQAAAPGAYTVSSLSTLINVVFASGGPSPTGSLRRVQLRRENRVVGEVDVYDFIVRGSKTGDVPLLAGDVIVYAPAGPRVAVMGSVDAPAVYELKAAGETLGSVVELGGGARAITNQHKAQLERLDPSQPRAARAVLGLTFPAAYATPLRDGDVLTLFAPEPRFSNAVTLRGSVARPLRHAFTPGMRVSTLIPERDALVTPGYYLRKNRQVMVSDGSAVGLGSLETDVRNIVDEPNWAYAVVERLDPTTLSMKMIPFNLGKAVIQRDPEHDILLEVGDVVTVFSHKDIQSPSAARTQLVRVEGEVSAPGIYQLAAGETLRGLLRRAGGMTEQAYVFGADFSRETTRRRQREALDEAVRRLEAQQASAAATQSANIGASDAQSVLARRQALLDTQRAQLSRLRAMQPTGRVALELDTAARGVDDLPDIALEDGDRLLVPTKPSFVFVVGSVANGNGMLWRAGRKLGEYLDLAGMEPDADSGSIFVMRADGTLVHSSRYGMFSSIEGLEMLPGDTVVVPGKSDRETIWSALVRGLKDWSQIFYQFGLAAAAIETLGR